KDMSDGYDSSPLENMMNRASVRRFEETPVPRSVIEKIVRVGQQAPFTGQMYSVVVTADPERREQLGEIFGRLPRVAPVFALLCIDFRRLEKFIEARGRENRTDDLSMLFLGIQDVAYMGQNMVLAAEACGLGSCFLGAAPFVAGQLREMFSLPERVYPLVGMVLGYPAENPPPRPRIPLECVLHWESYRDLGEEDVDAALQVMDAGLIREGYYRRLNGKIPLDGEEEDPESYDTYGWGEHVSRKYSRGRRVFGHLARLLLEQGIDVSQ
ncbi:MAG: nitroreductase family protein, partial [Bacillota bacterium]